MIRDGSQNGGQVEISQVTARSKARHQFFCEEQNCAQASLLLHRETKRETSGLLLTFFAIKKYKIS